LDTDRTKRLGGRVKAAPAANLESVMLVTDILIAMSFLIFTLCAIGSLVWVLHVGMRFNISAARQLFVDVLKAGIPGIATSLVLLAVFISSDPLWPNQDPTEAQMQQYTIARSRANTMYRYTGLAHCFTTCGVIFGLCRVANKRKNLKFEAHASQGM
jgi:hypothetical protein